MAHVTSENEFPRDEASLNAADVYLRGDGISKMDALSVQKIAQLITELPESYMD